MSNNNQHNPQTAPSFRHFSSSKCNFRHYIPTLIGIVLVAWCIWLHNLDNESLWRDEVDSIRFADEIWHDLGTRVTIQDRVRTLAAYLIRPGWNGPLYFLTLEGWLAVAGTSEFALRFPSALAGLAAVVLVFRLGSDLADRRTGGLAALFMGANPYLAWYAGEAKMYTLISAMAILSTLLLLRGCASGRRRYWIGYVGTTTVLFYTHILTPLLLPVQFGLVLLLFPRTLRSRVALLSAGALTMPYLPLLAWQWPHLRQPAETGFPFATLPTIAQRLAEVFSRGIIGWPATIPLVLLVTAMGVGVLAGRRRVRLGLLWWAVAPLLALFLISFRRPLFTERYLIWTLPAWLLLAAHGLEKLSQRSATCRRLAWGWAAGLLLCGLIGIRYQWTTPVRADFRAAAHHVRDRYQTGDLVLFQIPYLQATFDYYAPTLSYSAAEGPYTNQGTSTAEVGDYMEKVTANYPRVWLVLSEAPMWDARGLTETWLQEHGRRENTIAFNRVTVSQWMLEDSY